MKKTILVILLTSIISLGFLAACTPAEDEDISGYYRFKKTISVNVASSQFTTKENAPDYVITDESLIILYKDGTYEQVSAGFEKSEVELGTFASLFAVGSKVPDISGYTQRHQYSIDRHYCLFVMDDEVWLAGPSSDIWFIYQLVKVEGE